MSPPERRAALGVKERRRHPASPEARPGPNATPPGTSARQFGATRLEHGLVMLCVRVPSGLRRRIKLVAVELGKSVKELTTDALEAECRRRGV